MRVQVQVIPHQRNARFLLTLGMGESQGGEEGTSAPPWAEERLTFPLVRLLTVRSQKSVLPA